MLTKIIFVVVLMMPNGEFVSKSAVVASCPSIKMIGDYYEAQVRQGEIKDWNATCFNLNFKPKEAT